MAFNIRSRHLVFPLLFSLLLPIASYGQGKTVVVRNTQEDLVIHYFPARHVADTVLVNGNPAIYFPEAELTSTDAGKIVFPTESFLVAIPSGGKVTARVLDSEVDEYRNVSVAPIPRLAFSADSLRTLTRIFSEADPAGSAAPDEGLVRVSGEFQWRYQRVARIEVRPFRYDALSGSLARVRSLRIQISFSPSKPLRTIHTPDPHFEDAYRSAIVNYEQSKQWRAAAPSASNVADSTGTWFDPTKTYIKLSVGTDGLYAVPFDQVGGILNNTSPLNAQRLAMYYQGKLMPVDIVGDGDGFFGQGDTLLFYGSRLYDAARTLNAYSDTSAYWLSVDNDSTRRSGRDTAVAPSPDRTISGFRHTLRLEKDSIYFFGNGGLPSNNSTEEVKGEGWYWRRLFVNQSTSFSFAAANPDTSAVPFGISGRIHSPVQNQATPTHDLEILLNGVSVGVVVFNQDKDTIFSIPFSAALLQQGNNSVEIRSRPTAAALNEVLIDWIDVTIKEKLISVSDTLFFSGNEAVPGEVALYQVSGFSNSSLSAARIGPDGELEKIFSGSVTGSGPFIFSFTDTVAVGRRYGIVTQAKRRSVEKGSAKQFANLRSPSRGADYLIITAPEFNSAASQLALYRSQRGIGRTSIVNVDDIFDEFNFGHHSPLPVRTFLLAIDTLWQAPRPSYIVLFGDANWDAKDHMNTGRRDIVPSYGNPVADAWYASSAADPFFPQRFAGRIPVKTAQEAQEFTANIMAYENSQLNVWNKRFLFMSAGYTASESQRFQQYCDDIIRLYIETAPVSGQGRRIYRPPSNIIELELTDSIAAILDDGALWMNFFGHAGTEIWANGISQPSQLKNSNGKRHLVSDISCSTARFAEPLIEGFGEKMVLATTGGAIGYIGSSGFGYETPLRTLALEMYTKVTRDTVRELGKVVLAAKVRLWQPGTGSILTRQALNQFTLLGDPATRLALAIKPDYALQSAGIATQPINPIESDSISVRIPVLNYGLRGKDTVNLRLEHRFQSTVGTLPQIALRQIGFSDTITVSSALFRDPGLHTLTLDIDPQLRQDEVTRANNSVQFPFFVSSQQLLPLWPLPFSTVKPESVVLIVQNPNQLRSSAWAAYFELDTTQSFLANGVIRSPAIPQGQFVSEWRVPQVTVTDGRFYYWRARLFAANDSTNWIGGGFKVSSAPSLTWDQQGTVLQEANLGANVLFENGIRLSQTLSPILLYSAGFDAGDSAAMYVDGQNISLGLTERGYNVAVLNEHSGEVEQFAAFRTYSDVPDTTLVEPLIQILSGVDTGRVVLIAIADEGAVNKTERVNRAIESVGSGMIRSLGFRSSWAIIGRKGAAPGTVAEVLHAANGGPAEIRDTVLFAAVSGTLETPFIGPSRQWHRFEANVDTSALGTHIVFNMVRRFSSGTVDTVALPGSFVDPLALFVDSSVHDIRILARLRSDSAGQSPKLSRWSIQFTPSPEVGVNYQTVSVDRDSVLEGEPVTVTATIYNISPTPVGNLRVHVLSEGSVLDSTGVNIGPFASSDAILLIRTEMLAGKPPPTISLDKDDQIAERHRVNNIFGLPIVVVRDSVVPMFDVTFDGQRILEGDYVSPDPDIVISVRDNSPLPITDPNNVVLKLNNRRITLGGTPDSLFASTTGAEKARIVFKPRLQKGVHTISVQVQDASGNFADTSAREISFRVETASRLLNIVNIPNPISRDTYFTFNITGSQVPEEMRLRIYTVGGRAVYERSIPASDLRVGFNRIYWDARDRDGDLLANGVYFYKLSMNLDGAATEVIEKLAIIR